MVDDLTWQETARANLPLLYKLAHQALRNDADAQDAVQQALMHAWEKRGRVQADRLRAYLCRAVLNESRMVLRHRNRMLPTEELPIRPVQSAPDLRPLMQAIADLPEKYRWPVWLRYLEDLSTREAAEALGITVTALNSRIHRAKLLLRQALGEEADYEL